MPAARRGPHTYRFSLYALDQQMEIPAAPPFAQLDAVEATTDGASVTATYDRACTAMASLP